VKRLYIPVSALVSACSAAMVFFHPPSILEAISLTAVRHILKIKVVFQRTMEAIGKKHDRSKIWPIPYSLFAPPNREIENDNNSSIIHKGRKRVRKENKNG
jgi:hypothetical protein